MAQGTTSLLVDADDGYTPEPQPERLDIGILRPWRIALELKYFQVELVLDLIDDITMGRIDPRDSNPPEIDLRPFQAEELGVSRHHITLKLNDEGVAIVDNGSSNGTKLNGKRLEHGKPYLVRHGDDLVLGALAMRVKLLINPLE